MAYNTQDAVNTILRLKGNWLNANAEGDTKKTAQIAKDQTVVIIVDELDRCLPTYAIKVLERIHHIINGLENVVVIIAMEKKQIENSLHQIYGEGMDVDQYLKKFISFSIWKYNGKMYIDGENSNIDV